MDCFDTTVGGGGGGGGGANDVAEGALGTAGAEAMGLGCCISGALGNGALGGGGAFKDGAFTAGGGGGGGASRASLVGAGIAGAFMGAIAGAFTGAMDAGAGGGGGLTTLRGAGLRGARVLRGGAVDGEDVVGAGSLAMGNFAVRFARAGRAGGAATGVLVATMGVLAARGICRLGGWCARTGAYAFACTGARGRIGAVRRKFGINSLRPPSVPGPGSKFGCIDGAGAT